MIAIDRVLEENPVVAAVKDIRDIGKALNSGSQIIFMLCGSILNIQEIVERIKREGKYVCVHLDFVEGLGRDSAAVRFIKGTGADGIIATKPSLVKEARTNGIYAIQRLFMLDSRSLETGIKSILEERPNAVEIMPGSAARVIEKIHRYIEVPVIAGGLIFEKTDIIEALSKGAIAVSTSNHLLWEE